VRALLHATALMQSEKYAARVGGEIMHFSFHRVQRARSSRAFIRGHCGARVVLPHLGQLRRRFDLKDARLPLGTPLRSRPYQDRD